MYCQSDSIYVTYSRVEGIIINATTFADPKPLGDYILAWGKPTAVAYSYNMWYIYWGNVSVWGFGALLPHTEVRAISLSLDPGGTEPWQGFRQRPKP